MEDLCLVVGSYPSPPPCLYNEPESRKQQAALPSRGIPMPSGDAAAVWCGCGISTCAQKVLVSAVVTAEVRSIVRLPLVPVAKGALSRLLLTCAPRFSNAVSSVALVGSPLLCGVLQLEGCQNPCDFCYGLGEVQMM